MQATAQYNKIGAETNTMKKARLLKSLMDSVGHSFKIIDLAPEVYESERALYRLLKLNKLIPEFQHLLEKKRLSKLKAYELSNCSAEFQIDFYNANYCGTFIAMKSYSIQSFLKRVKKDKKVKEHITKIKVDELDLYVLAQSANILYSGFVQHVVDQLQKKVFDSIQRFNAPAIQGVGPFFVVEKSLLSKDEPVYEQPVPRLYNVLISFYMPSSIAAFHVRSPKQPQAVNKSNMVKNKGQFTLSVLEEAFSNVLTSLNFISQWDQSLIFCLKTKVLSLKTLSGLLLSNLGDSADLSVSGFLPIQSDRRRKCFGGRAPPLLYLLVEEMI